MTTNILQKGYSSLQRLWNRLTAPSQSIPKSDEQQIARLAASFFLAIALLTLFGCIMRAMRMSLVEAFFAPLGFSCATALVAYGFSRTKWYQVSIFIFSLGFGSLAYITMIMQGETADVGAVVLLYIPIGLVIAGAFLSGWAVWLLTGLYVGGLAFAVTFGGVPRPDNINAELGIITVLGVVLILLTNFRKRLENDRLMQIQEANKALLESQAHLEERVNERTRSAEEARQAAEIARQEAEAARQKIETQMWLATGQAQLSETMRGELGIEKLAENVVAQLCQYIGAQAGALYLLEGNSLALKGRYALAMHPGFDGNIKLGEGLVGQAAADGKLQHLAQIPDETIVISTSLAGLKPSALAAAPFYANGEVVGVLELASLLPFTANHLELWNRVSESIGVAFRTAQTRQRLADLLQKAHQQAEELQAQEEELRAANEELLAQTEKLTAVRNIGERR